MKKALALVMAIAMIASLAVVSMAAGTTQLGTTVNTTKPVYKVKPFATKLAVHNGTNYVDLAADDNVVFGDTVYAILIDEDGALATSDAVKGLTVDAKWTQNGDYVKGVELVKYKNVYAVAIATQGSSQTEVQVVGELALKGKSYYEVANEGAKETINYKTGIEILLAYETEDVTGDTVAPTDLVLYNFGHASTPAKVTVDFDEIQVSADTKGMKKVLFAYNNDVNEDLFDAYLDADLVFYNCVGSFRKTATVTVDLPEDKFFYEVVDGQVVEVEGEYDDWTEEFTFKTKTMGNYVISDKELVVAEVAVANPSTGAAA